MHKRRNERFYGRSYVGIVVVPYMFSLLKTKSIPYKVLTGYLIYTCLDALYDMGIYTYFFLHGPRYMRKILELPSKENFSSIQTRLFMRYCATVEIKKATQELPKKNPFELVFIRSIKN